MPYIKKAYNRLTILNHTNGTVLITLPSKIIASLKELGLNMPMRFDMILDRGKDGNLFIRLDNFQPSPAKAETTLKRRRAYRPPPSYMPASQIEERRLSDGRYHTAEEAARLGMNWNNHS